MKKKLSSIREGKEILCKSCKTRKYQIVQGCPKKDYGCIVMHKKGCKWLKKLLKNSVSV